MLVVESDLPGVLLLRPARFSDSRGWFMESWSHQAFREAGLDTEVIKDNVSLSFKTGTVRGLHFQRPPMAQAKLISVYSGRVLDVAVDLRPGSATYGRHLSVELSAAEGTMLFIPKGFAHGFCTLEDNTLVGYKVDAPYSPEHEGAIHWRDPDLGIVWPVSEDQAELSPKDLAAGPFAGRDHTAR
ncbi:dTDP-4-dehydrorhamnose 3,5-epimerase [Paramagnetospirillum magneticum]|uniref:dTDP-4-dehydrorhamnose 3,5-epimerase n=1 Tax=Paramagnetospirillum magneticum (strain ATCC 700264 / AMB-1) TaxID=342108 RepID=Q2W797_PARM1|nr:dTDP-4-dehydrorhamnose 3,5-epimerase [Paramagnetospirillum magneticum]BAE50278.1 dTDP-4-dehydrorhamnose 3,5-epimerase and related enzyme [Paramagnetospirillum magneticum AMB-1]